MPIQPQFNTVNALHGDAPEFTDLKLFGGWVNKYITSRLSQLFKGPTSKAWGAIASTFTLKLNDFALQSVTLAVNTTITLDTAHTRMGSFGYVEVIQNGTGGWTAAWTNALWAASTAPVVAAGAGKRTMLLFVHNGSGWVGSVLASNY